MKKLICLLLLSGLALAAAGAAEPAPLSGAPAPELELPTASGPAAPPINLRLYRGEKVILVFFTSWSKACQAELDDLQALYRAEKNGPAIVAVSFDKKSKELKAYLSKTALSFPILLDKKLSTIDSYQIVIIPTTFCLNPDGVIEKVFVDYDDNVKKALEEWLKS
ncbi:MAG: TlpA family protein disulfide reductase [Candidatus Saganbacteria bacterium]|nr:TlpA family protein disulfide reductase [Candidatus Saganbacteria bacterium]